MALPFSVGRNCQVVLLGPFGRVDLPNVMSFDAKQATQKIRVDRLDGIQLSADLPKGWNMALEVERGSVGVDQLFALAEAAWYSTGAYFVSTLYQYITESNNAVTTFQYDNVALTLAESGMWRGDQTVKQRIDMFANRRQII